MSKTKLLFICTANINRSRTAEDLFINSYRYEAKSAGIICHQLGGQQVNQELIDWVDMVFVMDEANDYHRSHLIEKFNVDERKVHVLHISDSYERGDKHLIEILKLRPTALGIITN